MSRRMPAVRTRLAYGVTTNHVLGLEFVLPDGTVVTTGGKELDMPGYDLTGLLTGSEGTMALITKVMVRLMRKPEMVKTILAIYDAGFLDLDSLTVRTAGADAATRWLKLRRGPSCRWRSRCWTA